MTTTQHTRRRGRRFHSPQRYPARPRRRLLLSLLPLAALLFSCGVYAAEVNINTADAATLDAELSGVGPHLAAAIVAYREEYGPFETVDDLSRVNGIGPVLVEKNRALLQVEDESQDASAN